jgi:hypothetical protein
MNRDELKERTKAGLVEQDLIADLYREADEILSMVVASIKTTRKRQ